MALSYDDQQKIAAQQYNDTIAGYKQQQNNFTSASGITNQGYKDLFAQQAKYGDSERQALKEQYMQKDAADQQGMIARGLGNTTGAFGAQRGNYYDYQKVLGQYQDQLYNRQNAITENHLAYRSKAAQEFAGLYGQKLSYMGQYGQQQQQHSLGWAQLGQQGTGQAQQFAGQAGQLGLGYYQANLQNQQQQRELGFRYAQLNQSRPDYYGGGQGNFWDSPGASQYAPQYGPSMAGPIGYGGVSFNEFG